MIKIKESKNTQKKEDEYLIFFSVITKNISLFKDLLLKEYEDLENMLFQTNNILHYVIKHKFNECLDFLEQSIPPKSFESLINSYDDEGDHTIIQCLKFYNTDLYHVLNTKKKIIREVYNTNSMDNILHYTLKNGLENYYSFIFKENIHIINLKNKLSQTPIFYLIFYSRYNSFKYFKNSVDINHKDVYGNTCIFYLLIFNCNFSFSRKVISHFANRINPNIQNFRGETILHICQSKEYDISVQLKRYCWFFFKNKVKQDLFDTFFISVHDLLNREVLLYNNRSHIQNYHPDNDSDVQTNETFIQKVISDFLVPPVFTNVSPYILFWGEEDGVLYSETQNFRTSSFIFVLISFDNKQKFHSNSIMIHRNKAYRYEPHGSGSNIENLYNGKELNKKLKELMLKNNIMFHEKKFPILGFQYFENKLSYNLFITNEGNCVFWCLFYYQYFFVPKKNSLYYNYVKNKFYKLPTIINQYKKSVLKKMLSSSHTQKSVKY